MHNTSGVMENVPDSTTASDSDHSPVPEVEDQTEMKPQHASTKAMQTSTTINDDDLPIDKGWAWVVLAGATFCFILYGGIKKNFGIFFVEIQDRFGSTASVTSLLITVQRLFNSFTSLITMTVGMQFISNRMVIMLGALVLTTSYMISAFATDVRTLFASIGVLEGIGKAFIYPPLTVSLLEYFHNRRGLANGLAFSGASLGGLIFAPVFVELFEKFGYNGTFMIVAGMTLNFLVTGALIRPVKSFKTRTSSEKCRVQKADKDEDSGCDTGRKANSIGNTHDNKTKELKSLADKLKAAFDVTLFKTPVFPIFLLTTTMLATATDLLLTFLAPLSNDIGVTSDQIGYLMAVVGGTAMLSRIIYGVLADKNIVKISTLLAVVSMIAGITAYCVSLFRSFFSITVMAVLLGQSCEVYHSLCPVVLVEYLTLSKAKSCMGFTVLCQGVAIACTYPLVGWLRDSTGSYYVSYYLLGTMSFVGALSALALPYAYRRSNRTETEYEVE